jgi:prephenate dehydratase
MPHALTGPLTLGFLGPVGSNTFQATFALLHHLGCPAVTEETPPSLALKAFGSLHHLLQATEAGACHLALIPYENALEGSVFEVLEALGNKDRQLHIYAELLQPITHTLFCQKGQEDTPLHTVLSHPMALAQCKESLQAHYPQATQLVPTTSTSQAVQELLALPPEQAAGVAALANPYLAQRHPNLYPLVSDLSDGEDNLTRFLVIGPQPSWPEGLPPLPQGATPKVSLCVELHEYPGVLMEYLQVFHRYWVNLTKLESRPARKRYGAYRFFMDMEGDLPTIAEGRLLNELTARSTYFLAQGPYACLGLLPTPLLPSPQVLQQQWGL